MSETSMVMRGGSALSQTTTGGALAESSKSREIAEVQAAMIIAKNFPRNQQDALDRIINACTRPTLAESACYQYARGGVDIVGPSIRLAETIAQNWGNFQFGIRELEQSNGESTMEAFAWDVETNTRQVRVFQVKHIRHTRQGVKQLTDPREIYELTTNQGARRVRACILGIVPGDVVEEAVKQCELTLKQKVDLTPERIHKMVTKFGEYGVTKEQIEERIQRRLDTMTPALFMRLGAIFNSIKDGMSKPAEWFGRTALENEKASPLAAAAKPVATTAPQPKHEEVKADKPKSKAESKLKPVKGGITSSEPIGEPPALPDDTEEDEEYNDLPYDA